MSNKDYSDVWEMLDGAHAKRVRVLDASLLGDEEIVRRWDIIQEGYVSRCMDALAIYTDAKNKKPQKWVENPVVDREEFRGVYRVVSLDIDVTKSGLRGIIQTLRKGFANEAKWAEARLVDKRDAQSNSQDADGTGETQSDAKDRELEVRFPNCDPTKIETIAVSLRDADYSSGVTIGGVTYSGAYHALYVSTKLEDDGSATATLHLATPQFTLAAYEDFGTDRAQDVYYVRDVPKELAQGILDEWKAANPTGASATTSYFNDRKLVDITLRRISSEAETNDIGLVGLDCRYSETQVQYLNQESPDLFPLPSAPLDEAGLTYTRSVRKNSEGRWDIVITIRAAQYRDIDGIIVEQSADSEVVQRQQLGLTDETPGDMAEESGVIKSQRVEVRDDCSRDVTTRTDTGKPLETEEIVKARSFEEITTQKTYQDSPLPDPETEAGYVKTVRNEQSRYPGKWNVLQKIRQILHLPGALNYDSADDDAAHESVEEELGKPNEGGVAVELAAGAGERLRAEIRYDKDSDTLDVKKTTIEGKEQITTEKTVARSFEETTTRKTMQASPLADPVSETGFIKTVRNEKSEFAGKYDTTERIREIMPIEETVEYDSADDNQEHAGVQESIGIRNEGGVVVELEAQDGEALSASVRYDKESDTLDVQKTTRVGKAQEGSRKTVSADREETVTEKTVQDNPLPDPAETTGKIVRVENRQSRYAGKYDTISSEEEGKPLETREYTVSRRAVEVRTAKTYQGSPLPDPSQEAGYIRSVRNEESRYPGKYDTFETERHIIEQENAIEYDVHDDAREHGNASESIGIKNDGGTVVELNAEDGETLHAEVQYDRESDTLDVKTVRLVGKEQVETEFTVTNVFTERRTEKTYQDSELPEPAKESGFVRVVKNSPSKYPGKFITTEIEREYAEDLSAAEYDSADDADHHARTIEQVGIRNEGGLVVQLDASEGEALNAEVRYNRESDTLDVTRKTETPKPTDTGWISYTDKDGTSYYRAFTNQDSPLTDGFDETTNNTLTVSKNKYGKYDGTCVRKAPGDSGNGVYNPANDRDMDWSMTLEEITYHVEVKITSSETVANSFVNGVTLIDGRPIGITSGIDYIGHGKYRAVRVSGA